MRARYMVAGANGNGLQNVRKLAAKENECDQENAIIRLPYTKDSSA